MKFLEDTYFCIDYLYSEVQYWHAPFAFLSHSVAIAAWSGIHYGEPQMIYFELFYHLVRRSHLDPTNNIVLD